MDLVVGAKKVIISMLHTQVVKCKETGEVQCVEKKLLKECKLPLTAVGVVNLIVTEMGVIEITEEGFVLRELHPDYTIEDVKEATDAEIMVHDDLKEMPV